MQLYKKLSASAVAVFCLALQGVGQTFEFIENKGQWDNSVKYKGELTVGAFFLQANGYRVLQYDTTTYFKALDYFTGHEKHDDTPRLTTFKKVKSLTYNDNNPPNNNNTDGKRTIKSHAYNVSFEGANNEAQIIRERQMPGYNNYFIGSDSAKWAANVHSFGALVYKEIYPGIDVRYYSENGFLKYDFIVQPNAPVYKIGLNYNGVEELKLLGGDLYIKTSVSTVKEEAPYSYQLVNGERKQVKCTYEVFGNTVKFKLTGYDPTKTLIIDPSLIFCSFTGSVSDNWGYTATFDAEGNLYAGGIVLGNNYPVTTGAFQTSWADGSSTGEGAPFDIAIMKFSPTGSKRIYATFLGGRQGNEQPHSLVVSGADLIIAGRSTSLDYPVWPTGNNLGQKGEALDWNIVISRLNAAGSALVGSVRIGGKGNDGTNITHKYNKPGPQSIMRNYGDDARSEVIVDRAGNICLASCTQSPDFPITASAFQKKLNGRQDGLVLKFNPNLSSLLFATYLGGSGDDATYVLGIAPNGDIFTAGGTTSPDFPGDKSGTVGSTFAGSEADGFIADLSSDGSTLIKSTFIATSGFDQVYGIQFDHMGLLYIQGTTTGSFPVINAAYSEPGGKQFIAKLSSDLRSYIYSTVWGSGTSIPNISPTAFLVDRCENVYVSGWGGKIVGGYFVAGTSGLTTTPDAIKKNTDNNDFYFIVFEKNAKKLLYASFFGQQASQDKISDHVDGGTSRFDQDGIIYQAICANCSGGQFPVTPGVVGFANRSERCNEAVVKIAFNLSGVRGGVKASIDNRDGDTIGCVPLTVAFRDTVKQGKRYEWNFDDGTPNEVQTTFNTSHAFTAVGDYRVSMITVDSEKCYPRDTSYVIIKVRQNKALLQASATKIGSCKSLQYRFDNQSISPLLQPFSSTSFTWIFGDGSQDLVAGSESVLHTFPATGTYNVKLVLTDTVYCNSPDTFYLQIRASPSVKAIIETPASACAPYWATFNNASLGGTSFFWEFGDGTTSTATTPEKFYPNPGVYTVKLTTVDTSSCNKIDVDSLSIQVFGRPTAAFSYFPNPTEKNIAVNFINESTGAIRYLWEFGDGDSLVAIKKDTIVKHRYRQTFTYNACLVAVNDKNCYDTSCQLIPITIDPLIDVVSAFTPNNDGVNDKAVVIGYGLEGMTFKIYNRWGQLVFETNDDRKGWDGTLNGKPQPMDAYGYTLEAKLTTGQTVKKSGSITLIR